jgi:hypothetical protein
MRMNNKRKCGFCKATFLSQRVYNKHVNTCTEIAPKRRTNVTAERTRSVHQAHRTTSQQTAQRKPYQGPSVVQRSRPARPSIDRSAQASVGRPAIQKE